MTCPGGTFFYAPTYAERKGADLSIQTVKITRRADRHHGDVNVYIYYDLHTNPSMLTISGPSILTKRHAVLLGNAILARIFECRHNRRMKGEDRRLPIQNLFLYANELLPLIHATLRL
jgi:hypothetical protein